MERGVEVTVVGMDGDSRGVGGDCRGVGGDCNKVVLVRHRYFEGRNVRTLNL